MNTLAEYRDRARLADGLAAMVAGQLAEALAKRGKATLAVPGGTTPEPFMSALSGAVLAWENISVMLTDERFVPESSPRSNTRLLRATLLQGQAAAANLVPLWADGETPEAILPALRKGVDTALPLDVLVLGMGADAHIASLFPGADRLAEALDPDCPDPILPMRAPGAAEPRLTLTAPVLLGAKHPHILITGPQKLATLKKAETPGPVKDAPVRLLLNAQTQVTIHYAE